ncbi:MAG TPA: AbrB/MazE/SpoVT family DNA-binding domain-containing protein [bacterium]|nr:AbrB/MazE/SpoVT family DNA-binding domain-containing protein [bacterium]HPQ66113.1 AbrB/MazE/SpoVT family DNA-binding domain-containing protein [bacterium]
MVTATLTSKGQITIPKAVRTSLNLHTGDRIEFIVHGSNEALVRPITKSVDEVFGKLHNPDQPALTIDDMNTAISDLARKQRT